MLLAPTVNIPHTPPAELPDVLAREAFVAKLARFRTALPLTEQRAVDAMVLAAFGAACGDVAGYGWVPSPEAARYAIPLFYRWGGLSCWDETPWASAYRLVPVPQEHA